MTIPEAPILIPYDIDDKSISIYFICLNSSSKYDAISTQEKIFLEEALIYVSISEFEKAKISCVSFLKIFGCEEIQHESVNKKKKIQKMSTQALKKRSTYKNVRDFAKHFDKQLANYFYKFNLS